MKRLIYDPQKKKAILIEPLGRRARQIYRQRIDAGENQASILPPELTYINGKFRKVKHISNFNNVRRITYQQVNSVFGDTQMNYIKNIFTQYKGQSIEVAKRYFSTTDEGNLVEHEDSAVIDVPDNGFNGWWRNWSQFLFPDSEDWIFAENYNKSDNPSEQAQLIIMSNDKVGQSNYQQYFLDGITHCVFTPIMNWAIERSILSQSSSTAKKYNAVANKLEKYLVKFVNGVHKDNLQSICNDLQIGIQIDVPSSLTNKNSDYINIRSQKKPHKIFRFINTRLNHIELNEVRSMCNYEEVSQKFLNDLVDTAIEKEEYCLWKGDINNVYQVNTLDRIYKLAEGEGYNKEVNEFEDINNLREFKIEHFSNKLLSKYLLNNTNPNTSLILNCPYYECEPKGQLLKEYLGLSPDELDKQEDKEVIELVKSCQQLNHIDMRKAYTRGAECSYYQGYLGKITDFRKTDKIMGLGIYMIYNIQGSLPLLNKLGVLHEYNSYPSPELEFYKSLGIRFDICMGCWGSSANIDFGDDWTSGMFIKEDGLSHYCKWYGCSMRLTTKERYNFTCKDIEFAKLNNIQDDCDVRYNQYKGVGIIQYKKQKAYHSSQLATFIHSYCRISMIEQLLKFKDISQIVAVQVDGIFYKGDVQVLPLFSEKTGKSLRYIEGDTYIEDVDYCFADYSKLLADCRVNNPIELHTGPGGAGKTHYNLLDKGLQYPLYVAPSWKLARSKQGAYGCASSVFYYLTCADPDVWRPIQRNYNTLIIDEISMLSNSDKNLILTRFTNHKIIFCGDLGYQLPPVEGYPFACTCKAGQMPTIKHLTNYRCKCPKLAEILKRCRKVIDLHGDDRLPIKKIITDYGFAIKPKEDIDYDIKDLIIAKTHKNKDTYTDKLLGTTQKKWMVLENTRDYSNGEIVIGEKPEGVNSTLQHAFTIHSIQGETANDKLFIDINKVTSMRMLYTALSRAKYFNQINIII